MTQIAPNVTGCTDRLKPKDAKYLSHIANKYLHIRFYVEPARGITISYRGCTDKTVIDRIDWACTALTKQGNEYGKG